MEKSDVIRKSRSMRIVGGTKVQVDGERRAKEKQKGGTMAGVTTTWWSLEGDTSYAFESYK
jgi:hypothetical protein